MSFDEQPDGDPHGECAAEIASQVALKERYMRELLQAGERIRELEVALRSVRAILQSDSIEYDDMRHINHIIDEALADSPPSAAAADGRQGEP